MKRVDFILFVAILIVIAKIVVTIVQTSLP